MRNFSAREIPIVGDDLYQVGKVFDIMSNGCTPEPWLMVNGFFTYVPQFIWSFVKPDPQDLILDRFAQPHKRKRKRKFRASSHTPKPISPNGRAQSVLLSGAEVLNKIGAFLLIADATTDLLVNWTSLAYTWSGCLVSGVPVAEAWGQYGFAARAAGNDQTIVSGTNAYDQGNASASYTEQHVFELGPKQFMGSGTFRVEPWAGIQGHVTDCWLDINYGGGVHSRIQGSKDHEDGSSSTWNMFQRLWLDNLGPVTVRMYVSWSGGDLYFDDMHISVTGAPNSALEFDP